MFAPSDVLTDGSGNILQMPLLERKPCFARPEVVIRQMRQTKTIKVHGRVKTVPASRCGECKISEACRTVAIERVKSDQDIKIAVREWADHCRQFHKGVRIFVGPIEGRMWERIKRAIADRGPWTSSNDAALAELAEPKKQKQREKWRNDKIRQRAADRANRADLHKPPTRELLANVIEERDRRAVILEQRAGDPILAPSISKISPEDAPATAAITADVWLVDYILAAMGLERNPGLIARKLIAMGRAGGRTYGTLRQRIPKDLKRVRDLEVGRTPVWSKFDPDCDLPTAPAEIDAIMREMDDPYGDPW